MLHHELLLKAENLAFRKTSGEHIPLATFDWVWVLGFGSRTTFLDRIQLLHFARGTKFVNSAQAILLYHNKAALGLTELKQHTPKFHVSEDVDFLVEQIRQGGNWIAKPTAGSFGRDVFELTIDTANLHQILENLTRQGHTILQERVDTSREQRWFLAMGTIIGVYQKAKSGLRGNLDAHATPVCVEPNAEEHELASAVASKLLDLDIRACAVDLAYPYLLDVNFINPGWFESMEHLTGKDFAKDLPGLFEQEFH